MGSPFPTFLIYSHCTGVSAVTYVMAFLFAFCVCVCVCVCAGAGGEGAGAVTAGPGFHFFVYWCVVKTRSLRVCCHPTFFPLFCRSARARSDGVTV